MKVVLIGVDKKCCLIDWEFETDHIFTRGPTDSASLNALESEGYRLMLIGYDAEIALEMPYNSVASKLFRNLAHKNQKIPKKNVSFRGPIILVDENSNLSDAKWNYISEYVKNNK